MKMVKLFIILFLFSYKNRNIFSHFAIIDIVHIGDDCQVTPVIHVLQYPGCVPKPIPSFACVGRCASYIQVRINSSNIFDSIKKIVTAPTLVYIYLYIRYLVVKFGKWNVHVCVAKSPVNEKLQYHYFVQKPNQENKNLRKFLLKLR